MSEEFDSRFSDGVPPMGADHESEEQNIQQATESALSSVMPRHLDRAHIQLPLQEMRDAIGDMMDSTEEVTHFGIGYDVSDVDAQGNPYTDGKFAVIVRASFAISDTESISPADGQYSFPKRFEYDAEGDLLTV